MLVALAALTHGQAPQLINYQGRLVDGTNMVNGTVGMAIRLFNVSSGGSSLYEDSNAVTVIDGLYSTIIGDQTNSGNFINALTNASLYISVEVNGTELSPRERVTSTPYSLATRGVLVVSDRVTVNPTLNKVDGTSSRSTIAGGQLNQIHVSASSFIGGGNDNIITNSSPLSVISGGSANSISNATRSFIGGGEENKIGFTTHSAIPGGYQNTVGGGGNAIIGAGMNNTNTGTASFIGAGFLNRITGGSYSFLGGGWLNWIFSSDTAMILGGNGNIISNGCSDATIAGGGNNRIGIGSTGSFIGGGGGHQILSNAFGCAIVGGSDNRIINMNYGVDFFFDDSIIAGGTFNTVLSSHSFSAGNKTLVTNTGSFVWGDYSSTNLTTSTRDNSWVVRAVGGARFITGINNAGTATSGVSLATGSGTWTSLSDRNAKENFGNVNTLEILAKVSSIPIQTWNYKTQDHSIRHIGPTAQDFKAAFGVGESDTGITTVDADGVALAAIQALARQNAELEEENASLQERLTAIEQLLGL